MGSFNKLKNILEERDGFLLICHEQPDGDALGSLLAMGDILEEMGKRVSLVCKDEVPDVFKFLPDADQIKKDFLAGNFDAIILMDNGDLKRTGFADRLISSKIPIINIDHHSKNDIWKYAYVNYVNEEVSSCAELIYEIISGFSSKISPRIATCLLTGIYNDTGGFHHTNTSPKVLKIVSDLLNRGAKLKAISDNISRTHSINRLKLWGTALNRLRIIKDYDLAVSYLTLEDIKTSQASEDEVSGLIGLINSIPDSKIALLLYETSDGNIKGSLRTEDPNVDVSKLARKLGGGGHKKAAGFTIDGKINLEGYCKVE